MKQIRWNVLLMTLLLGCGTLHAQGTIDDYRRAFSLREKYSNKVFYADVTPHWIDGTHCFWYVRRAPGGNTYVMMDADKQLSADLFVHTKLANALSEAVGREVNPEALDLKQLVVDRSLDTLRFVFDDKQWIYAVRKNDLTGVGSLPSRQPKPSPRRRVVGEKKSASVFSPDGRYAAFIKDYNIYVTETTTGVEKQLSMDGTSDNYYSAFIQWSPDSKKVAVCKIRPAEKRYIYYLESSPADQIQPKLYRKEYAKPGDELDFKVPCIYEVETGRAIIPDTKLFDQQYELRDPLWDSDSRAITFEYNQRGHQVYRLLELSVETGEVRPLIEENSDKYVNYPRIFRHHLTDGRHIIWSSERDNWNHLYLYDRTAAQPVRQITRGQWYVRQVLKVDEENQQIYFTANGVQPDEDPYLIRYYRIGFDGLDMTCLTPDKGMHQAWFSDDMRYLVDVYSMVDKAPVAVLRDATDGRALTIVEQADISHLEAEGWKAPEVFTAKGRDGQTDMWGIIIRPTNFDPSKKYPVLEYIYQGPGDQYVPKAFIPYNEYMTSIAELGFIVVMVDGMGTSFRSRSFENICHRNLKDAGLPDHMAWIKAAAAKYPYMDLDRVGIFGCSAGGQESMTAVLFYPEFYKAAYSACGCHDNRMDKIWWNELWLGYPVGEQYEECSNVENAHLLTRPLMLVVGEMDDNVDPASTMQVVNALIKANKDFELVVIPGARHTMGGAYGEHKRYDFFVKNLLNVNPPRWDELETEKAER